MTLRLEVMSAPLNDSGGAYSWLGSWPIRDRCHMAPIHFYWSCRLGLQKLGQALEPQHLDHIASDVQVVIAQR